MRNNNFTNKQEYLQYRKDWKAEYKELSGRIRSMKQMHKIISTAHNKARIAHGDCWYGCGEHNQRYWDYYNLLLSESRQYQVIKDAAKDWAIIKIYQNRAYEMILELWIAKKKANHQYLSSKKLEVV